jgi:hypothetical protein
VPSGTPVPQSTGAAAAATKPADVLYQLTDLGRLQSFAPIYSRATFWALQIAPLIVLLGLAGWKIRQAKIDNRQARRLAAMQHESAELARKLRRADLSPQEYFSNAARAVRLKTALLRNVDPNTVDVEAAEAAFALDETEREQLRRLFQRSDELRYSGGDNGAGSTSAQDREEILNLVESLRG